MSILRQDIVDAMKTRFLTIATTTYHNTLSGKVFIHYGKTTATGTLVDIRDTQERIEEHASGAVWDRRVSVDIDIQTNGAASDTTVRQLMEDILKSIGTDRTWSGKAIDTSVLSSNIEVEHEEKRISGATISVEILYRTGAFAES